MTQKSRYYIEMEPEAGQSNSHFIKCAWESSTMNNVTKKLQKMPVLGILDHKKCQNVLCDREPQRTKVTKKVLVPCWFLA